MDATLKVHHARSETKLIKRSLSIVLLAAALGWPASALADTAASSNWAGYAVHRAGVAFRTVLAMWRQPSATCVRGRATYSAFWVGLGGFSPNSGALEQTGTELDCSRSGKVVSSAWYELVPAPSRTTGLTVRPGDSMSASVTVVGRQVTLSLYDATRRKGFHKVLTGRSIDVSSAEWIVEAPSECADFNSCKTLPLANFRSASFDSAQASSGAGSVGSISSGSWNVTKIKLIPGGRRFVVLGPRASVGAASPSPLHAGGSSFRVTYSRVQVRENPILASPDGALRAGYIVHAGR